MANTKICGLEDCENDNVIGNMFDGTPICGDCASEAEVEK